VLGARAGVQGARVDQLGAKDFVVKPFQAERVIDAVGKALA
jgi:FixJ family two-component response regulator